jgi:hypothetical protein
MSVELINSFLPLQREVRRRLADPMASVTFWTYAILSIGVCGGLAIWIELVIYAFELTNAHSVDGLRLAIITYFPAIGCSAAHQLLITEKERSYMRSFGYFMSLFFIGSCIFAFLLELNHPNWSMALAIISSVMSLIVWWIANGSDPAYHDTDPDIPVGGSISTSLPGDVTGFQV